MKTTIYFAIAMLGLIGCGTNTHPGSLTATTPPYYPSTSPNPSAMPIAQQVPVVAPTPTPSPNPSSTPDVMLTVYSFTQYITASDGSWRDGSADYEATAWCTVYNSQLYCWDDGIHEVKLPGLPNPTGWTYFEKCSYIYSQDCNGDLMAVPTAITTNTAQTIRDLSTQVLNSGTQSEVDCTTTPNNVACEAL